MTTVADESRLLAAHLEYQRHLGVDEFLLYCDPESDVDPDALYSDLRGRPGVHFLPGATNAQAREQWPDEDYGAASAFLFRQGHNSGAGLAQARRLGADWVLNLDPDELLCLDFEQARKDELKALLALVPAERPAVHFPCLEVVQAAEHYEDVFAQETRFKNLFLATPQGVESVGPRARVHDPASGEPRIERGYYGPVHGKGAVRASYPATALGWAWRTPQQQALVDYLATELRPVAFVLHYYRYDFDDFWSSFAINFRAGRVARGLSQHHRALKRAWFELVARNRDEPEVVREYFRRHVMFDPATVDRRLAEQGPRSGFVRVAAPARFFGHDAALADEPHIDSELRILGASKTLCSRYGPIAGSR